MPNRRMVGIQNYFDRVHVFSPFEWQEQVTSNLDIKRDTSSNSEENTIKRKNALKNESDPKERFEEIWQGSRNQLEEAFINVTSEIGESTTESVE